MYDSDNFIACVYSCSCLRCRLCKIYKEIVHLFVKYEDTFVNSFILESKRLQIDNFIILERHNEQMLIL